MFRYAVTLVAYAFALVASGYVTYMVAPPGGSAITAVAIPGVIGLLCVVCAVLSLMIKSNRKLGMIGVHVGLLLPVLTIAGTVSRLSGGLENVNTGNENIAKIIERAEGATAAVITPREDGDGLDLAFAELGEPVDMTHVFSHKGYQVVGIASSAAISLFALVALLAQRPKLPPKEKKHATADAE